MCSRHAEPGALDPRDLPRPFRVSIVSRDDEHDRPRWESIPAAIGSHDARHQAEDLFPGCVILAVEEMAQVSL